MWKRLLVPIDSSECSGRAVELAAAMAEREGASLTLVHISPLPPNLAAAALVTPPGAREAVRIDEYTASGAQTLLEPIAAKLRERGLDVRTLARSTVSDVAGEILRVARDTSAEAIVLGTHGRSGLAHFFLGSVAERVIRSATVPVVTVRSPAPEADPTREERFAEDELTG